MNHRYHGRYYAKAQNLIRLLRRAYDNALREVDLLVMPTTAPAGKARPIKQNPTRAQFIEDAFCYHLNACPFNMTGHPAISVPCGKSDGLPIGMMLIGHRFDEALVLRGAHASQSLRVV